MAFLLFEGREGFQMKRLFWKGEREIERGLREGFERKGRAAGPARPRSGRKIFYLTYFEIF